MATHQEPPKPPPLNVTLDGQAVELPSATIDSLAAIQAHLECLAMKNERVLWTLQVDGVKFHLANSAIPLHTFRQVQAQTISLNELGEYLVILGRAKTRELLGFTEKAILLVLINDWAVTRKLWQAWQPEFREPLFSLRSLQELRGEKLLDLPLDGKPLSQHLEEISAINTEIESLLQETPDEGSPVIQMLSDILEKRLLPWLQRLSTYFDLLDEPRR